VNIAARLESIAHAGEVLISEAAFQQVKGTEGLRFSDLASRPSRTSPAGPRLPGGGRCPRPAGSVDVRYLLSRPAVAVLPSPT
jgi:class 3 adenylate cyclase